MENELLGIGGPIDMATEYKTLAENAMETMHAAVVLMKASRERLATLQADHSAFAGLAADAAAAKDARIAELEAEVHRLMLMCNRFALAEVAQIQANVTLFPATALRKGDGVPR